MPVELEELELVPVELKELELELVALAELVWELDELGVVVPDCVEEADEDSLEEGEGDRRVVTVAVALGSVYRR